eukprot:1975131-Rhodomonas_salina.1
MMLLMLMMMMTTMMRMRMRMRMCPRISPSLHRLPAHARPHHHVSSAFSDIGIPSRAAVFSLDAM